MISKFLTASFIKTKVQSLRLVHTNYNTWFHNAKIVVQEVPLPSGATDTKATF